MAELEAARLKLNEKENRVIDLEVKLAKSKKHHENFLLDLQSSHDLKSYKTTIEELRQRLETVVPHAEWASMRKRANALHDENIFLKTQIGNMRAALLTQVNIVKAQIRETDEFLEEVGSMVPRSELMTVQVKAQRLDEQVQELRSEKQKLQGEVLEAQQKAQKLKTEIEDLEEKLRQMVRHFLGLVLLHLLSSFCSVLYLYVYAYILETCVCVYIM